MHIVSEAGSAKRAGHHLSLLLADAGGIPVLLLLSGGSALDILPFVVLPEKSGNLTIMIVDERFDQNPEENNFSRMQKTEFYGHAEKAGAHFISTAWGVADTVENLGMLMDTAIKNWRTKHPEGLIYVTLGIGTDGHTAGMMPFPDNPLRFEELFNNPDTFAIGYDAGAKNPIPLRATVTVTMLRLANAAIVYAVGEAKSEPLLKALGDKGTLAETPARIFRELKNIFVFNSTHT